MKPNVTRPGTAWLHRGVGLRWTQPNLRAQRKWALAPVGVGTRFLFLKKASDSDRLQVAAGSSPTRVALGELSIVSPKLHEEIGSRLADGFERKLYNAALRNLDDNQNPLRFNNFSYATRELMRHVLARLAPDEEVLKCSWYANETGRDNGISRKQRVYYAVHGGLSDEYVVEHLNLDISKIHRSLRDAVDNLSKHTHIEASTFDIPEKQVGDYVDDTLSAVAALFQTIDESRRSLTSALWEHIDDATIDTALRETILSIDEIATHHSIEEIYTDKVGITKISSQFIEFEAVGSVSCELQWGSNGDLRRGDGAVLPQSFPFTCRLWSSVEEPNAIQTDEDAFSVDTSSWWEGYYDEDPR